MTYLRDLTARADRLAVALALGGTIETLEELERTLKRINGHIARCRREHDLRKGWNAAKAERQAARREDHDTVPDGAA